MGYVLEIVESHPSSATVGNWCIALFQFSCLCGRYLLVSSLSQGILPLIKCLKLIPNFLISSSTCHFYGSKIKMRLSGIDNNCEFQINCEVFLLEISASHCLGKIFSSIIHYKGLKIILQWQSLYLFLDNWHPLLADLECFFDDNVCDPAGFAEWLNKQRQIVKCGKEKAIFIILENLSSRVQAWFCMSYL